MALGRQPAENVGKEQESKMRKEKGVESSVCERPRSFTPRRLADWLNPTGEKKVHSLIDKIYKLKNLEIAWQKVKSNRGSSGVDEVSIPEFEANLADNLKSIQDDLIKETYTPMPALEHKIPKAGQPGKYRKLGIPALRDRVCQQAMLNRLQPIFEPIFDPASFGYRPGRSTKDALRKVWLEIHGGNEWIVDADLRDFFGSADQEKLLTLVNQRVSDSRVLKLLKGFLKSGCIAGGRRLPTDHGTVQGGVISPILSNLLLTPFDCEMRRKGYSLTRFADDWVATCRTKAEAKAALRTAEKILSKLGVTLHPEKTRIVHVRHGFEFLGFKIKKDSTRLRLSKERLTSNVRSGMLYAYPRDKSTKHFMNQVRALTRRKAPLRLHEVIARLNPIIRGWGNYFCRAQVRKLFNRLDRWIIRRIWSQRFKRWRNAGWKILPRGDLYGNYGLVNLVSLIPSISPRKHSL